MFTLDLTVYLNISPPGGVRHLSTILPLHITTTYIVSCCQQQNPSTTIMHSKYCSLYISVILKVYSGLLSTTTKKYNKTYDNQRMLSRSVTSSSSPGNRSNTREKIYFSFYLLRAIHLRICLAPFRASGEVSFVNFPKMYREIFDIDCSLIYKHTVCFVRSFACIQSIISQEL